MLDGELIVKGGEIASFSHLQQRLNRKSPDPKLIAAYPGHIILYDALALDGRDLRPLPLTERKAELARWFDAARPAGTELAPPLAFRNPGDLQALRAQGPAPGSPHIEGLMLKRLDSPYVPGRPKGLWYKWKRDPKLADAVLMYAQRGTGKRSSLYTGLHLRALARGRAVAHRQGRFRLHGRGAEGTRQMGARARDSAVWAGAGGGEGAGVRGGVRRGAPLGAA